MPLDASAMRVVEYFNSLPKFSEFKTAAEYREAVNKIFEESVRPISEMEKVSVVEDKKIGEIRIRIYQHRPKSPAIVFYHGGGFVLGSIEVYDAVCKRLARLSNATVVSVDYRLAPEHKFPAAVEDAYRALKFVADKAEELEVEQQITVCGDSAGGNIAAVVAIMARDKGEDIVKQQVLVYPVVDLRKPTVTRSSHEFVTHGLLTEDIMKWFRDQYLRSDEDSLNSLASPILANLENLPPATIITAEYDPLRDEGEIFGHLLKKAGNDASIIRFIGMIHGFLNFYPILKAGRDAISLIASLL